MKFIDKYIGTWGRYQAYVYALYCFPFFISGSQIMLFNFTGAVPKTRCFLPGLDGGDQVPEFNSSDLFGRMREVYLEPGIFGGSQIYCSYRPDVVAAIVAENNNSSRWMQNSSNPAHRTDTTGNAIANKTALPSVSSCNGAYVYDQSQYVTTLVADLGMVCENKWKRSLASSCYMFGFLVGAAISGSLSDRFGRKPVFVILSWIGMVDCHILMLTDSFPMLCALHILGGACFHGAYLAAFVAVMENIGGSAGTYCGIWVNGMFAMGYVYVGICAYFIRQWRWLQFAVSFPTLALLPYCWLFPESIRWLIVNGKKDEASKQIVKAAACNNVPIQNHSELEDDINKVLITETASVEKLFTQDRSLAVMTLIVFYSWFATCMAYYGISLNISYFPGNQYIIYILSGLVQLPGYAVVVPMMEKLGRRFTSIFFLGAAGVPLVATCFLPESWAWLTITLVMIGKLGAATSFAVIYNYSAELFPTVARNAGMGIASSCARIASMSAPQIYLLGQFTAGWVPFFLYGMVAVVAATLNLFLPETLGKPFPESIQDGVLVAKKQWALGVDPKLVLEMQSAGAAEVSVTLVKPDYDSQLGAE